MRMSLKSRVYTALASAWFRKEAWFSVTSDGREDGGLNVAYYKRVCGVGGA